MQRVYHFDTPMIGYCPDCDELAIYHNNVLRCPKCRSTDLSIFIWDGQSKYPEHDEVEEPEDLNW